MDGDKPPCTECALHDGGWQACECLVTLPPIHDHRCSQNKQGPCPWYKPKQ